MLRVFPAEVCAAVHRRDISLPAWQPRAYCVCNSRHQRSSTQATACGIESSFILASGFKSVRSEGFRSYLPNPGVIKYSASATSTSTTTVATTSVISIKLSSPPAPDGHLHPRQDPAPDLAPNMAREYDYDGKDSAPWYRRKRTWAIVALAVIIAIVVPVAVTVTRNKKHEEAYPDYSKLNYTLLETCMFTSTLFTRLKQ